MDEATFFQKIKTGAVSGAYFLYGPEPYSRERALEGLTALVDGAARELNVQILKNPLPEDAVNACDTLPFFSERRLVILRELSADTATALASYVERVPETTVLAVDQRGAANAQGALFKTLSKLDRTVEFEAFSPERAALFVEKRAAEAGVSIERSAARQLIEWLGTDLSTLHNTVRRLAGYVGDGGRVTGAAVEACVTPSPEYRIFVVLDQLIAGNKRDALRQLVGMVKSGADTSMRLASFFEGRIRQMLSAKQLLLQGMTEQEIVKRLGGSPYAAKKTVQNARKCKLERLASALDAFAAVDWRQKQGLMKDDDALLLAVLQQF